MPHDVFISYSSKDQSVAETVCRHLEEHGIHCWIAPRDIVPGQNYAAAIVDGISSAKVFLLIFSSHANASNQVERELERAVAKKLTVLPFRIEDFQPAREFEYWISTPHWLDAYPPPLEPHLQKLTASIDRIMGHVPPHVPRSATAAPPRGEVADGAAPIPAESNRLSQKIVIASGAATFALAGVVVASMYLRQPAHTPIPVVPSAMPLPVDAALKPARELLKQCEDEIEKWEMNSSGIVDAEQVHQRLEAFREARQEIQALRESDARRLGLDERASRLLERYDAAIAGLEVKRQDAQLDEGLSDLDSAVGDPARFAEILNRLARGFPKARAASELTSVAVEEPYWTGVETWDEFLSRTSFSDPALAPAAAAKIVADAAKLPPISPFVEYYLGREAYLNAIAGRVDFNNDPITGGLRQYLSNRWMNDLYVVELDDGTRYYLNEDPAGFVARSNGDVKLQYIVNARRETKYDWKSPKSFRYRGRAPHCELANEILQSLDDPQLLTTEWVPTFCQILQRIADDGTSDPVARALIFEQTLQTAALGSNEIGQAFQQQTASLAERGIDSSVAWFNPSDSRAVGERKKAEELFRTLPPVALAARESTLLADKWRKGPPPKFRWIGWLRKDAQQRWSLAGAKSLGERKTAYVVAKLPGETRIALQDIGEVSGSNARWKTEQLLLRVGRPVFIQVESP